MPLCDQPENRFNTIFSNKLLRFFLNRQIEIYVTFENLVNYVQFKKNEVNVLFKQVMSKNWNIYYKRADPLLCR